jgi:NAD(P)-dependent dehydrogenase (short-subunit alcohol dehydrogenase family)
MLYKDFSNKVVLVTGGTTGIGYSAAKLFILNGATVVITGSSQREGEMAEAELRRISKDVEFIKVDVAVETFVKNMLASIVRKYGRLDIAFNNAGIEGAWKAIEDTSEDEFDSVIEANLKGTFICCKHEIIQFKKQRTGGVIINTSSWLAKGVSTGSAVYSASKAAVDSLTKSIAVEEASSGIRINNVSPGFIETATSETSLPPEREKTLLQRQVPLGELGKPKEVAELVLWLASSASSYVTGQSILIDGGLAIACHSEPD